MYLKRINLLDENTSNKIAAGEVVEGPSSVVKELIENSIDAKSKNIIIEIEDGGTSLIRITDDGIGIHPDDIKLAFLPHATSKIKSSEDIYSISTLGFRGEALPSIASVSNLTIKSRIEGMEYGKSLNISAGEIIDFSDCACNIGTTIEVKDLFFNVPARKKFLKSTAREGSKINDIVNRIAISHDDISVKLFNGAKKVLHTFGNNNLKDTLRTIYGKNISDNLIYFENAEDKITLYGYIGKENIARGSRNNQSIFVNGRYVKHKTIVAAVENAFKSFSTVNKFPFFVLFIEVYPEFVDVNIHPTKAEIKFDDDRELFGKVFHTIHDAYKKEVFDSFDVETKEDYSSNTEFTPVNTVMEKMDIDAVMHKKEKVNVSFPLDLHSEHKEITLEDKKDISRGDIECNESVKDYADTVNNNENKELNNQKEDYNIKEQEKEEKVAKFPPIKIIGQFNKTYILGEYDEVLYMIDQHAAHEKILFEKYMSQIEHDNIVVQPLLVPAIIELGIDDYCTFNENKDVFIKAGFIAEDFGGNSVALKEVPYFVGKLNPKPLFLDIIDNLKNLGSGKTTDVKYNAIATMACKAAIKANNQLNDMEMVKLVEDLRYINDPFHCPHGRPTIIKLSNYEIEKMFRRIV